MKIEVVQHIIVTEKVICTSAGVQELSVRLSPLSVKARTGEPSATVLACTINPLNCSPPDPDRVTADRQDIAYKGGSYSHVFTWNNMCIAH